MVKIDEKKDPWYKLCFYIFVIALLTLCWYGFPLSGYIVYVIYDPILSNCTYGVPQKPYCTIYNAQYDFYSQCDCVTSLTKGQITPCYINRYHNMAYLNIKDAKCSTGACDMFSWPVILLCSIPTIVIIIIIFMNIIGCMTYKGRNVEEETNLIGV